MSHSHEATATLRWGFIGAGKMATALIRGMIRAGTARPDSVHVSDPVEAARSALAAVDAVVGDLDKTSASR